MKILSPVKVQKQLIKKYRKQRNSLNEKNSAIFFNILFFNILLIYSRKSMLSNGRGIRKLATSFRLGQSE